MNGDGAFGINAMEIDTAVRYCAGVVFIVSDNAAWNIERYDREESYGGRVIDTTPRHSDYAAMADVGDSERVESDAEFVPALERALAKASPVVDVVPSQDAVSLDASKGLGHVPAGRPLTAWTKRSGAGESHVADGATAVLESAEGSPDLLALATTKHVVVEWARAGAAAGDRRKLELVIPDLRAASWAGRKAAYARRHRRAQGKDRGDRQLDCCGDHAWSRQR